MNLIVAVDKNWSIGKDGGLLVSIPEDMKLFRDETMGKVVVMGRKTFESLGEKGPLDGRVNIVLTSDVTFNKKGVIVCHNMDELFGKLSEYDDEDIFVIGGGKVYEQLLPYVSVAHITKIDYKYMADTTFPNLDEMDNWNITEYSDEKTYFDLEYYFYKYENSNSLKY